jgi:Ribbon-helix-helix protein, copG family
MANTISDSTASRSPQDTQPISISLSGNTAELLEFLATSQGISQNEAIRRAISTEAYFLKEHQLIDIALSPALKQEIRDGVILKKKGASNGIAITLIVFFGVSLLAEFLLIGLGAFYAQANSDLIKDTLPLLINSLTCILSLALALYFREK